MAQDYKVIGQKQEMNINPAGTGFTQDWVITYEVTSGAAKGSVATITVPASDHNTEYIDTAIRDKLSDLHGIASLGMSS
jgi:hypothetical protein